ncbi:MAG: hypothetical protein E7364_06630 [Clostridiales bacterium]|nr:hypothetical protein [Clostridiales bacterium]MBQ3019669.1 hypothetical protein [Clostridia bacterium]
MAKKKRDDLDTETTFADMNVEGFKWYDPQRKKNGKRANFNKPSKKEYWAMVRGAFRAYAPMFLSIICGFGIMILLMYLWLQ